MNVGITIAVLAGALALVLYYVVLPHAEGPPPEKQAADVKQWLVKCPKCEKWQTLTPRVSSERESREQGQSTFENHYQCPKCLHRWHENVSR